MLWRIDPSADEPLFAQVATAVRRAVAEGEVEAGDRLPSARELAGELEINMHTVLRGYRELVEQGVIEMRRGRGAVVVMDARQAGVSHLGAMAATFVAEARRLGVAQEEAARFVREVGGANAGTGARAIMQGIEPSGGTV
ncbi:GntR family transcriptional regulator [Kytococcus sp. Marseille-QA3725]